jgi:hypothetical protein
MLFLRLTSLLFRSAGSLNHARQLFYLSARMNYFLKLLLNFAVGVPLSVV